MFAVAALAPLAQAGGQQVVAQVSADGHAMVVRTYRCGTPSSLSLRGSAEGLVSGERRSLELAITPGTEAGVFRVARQWPAEGRWVLVLNVTGDRGVSTLVTLEPGASLKIADQKQSFEKPQAERIAAALGGRHPHPPRAEARRGEPALDRRSRGPRLVSCDPEVAGSMPSADIPLIIDVEASGFGGASYPIEIGGARRRTQVLRLDPARARLTHWDAEAERVHRIPRDGPGLRPARERRRVTSPDPDRVPDGWVVDKPWLTTLFHAVRIDMQFHVSPLELILSESQMDCWHREKDAVVASLHLSRHRASHDAWVIQETYRRTRSGVDSAGAARATTASFPTGAPPSSTRRRPSLSRTRSR